MCKWYCPLLLHFKTCLTTFYFFYIEVACFIILLLSKRQSLSKVKYRINQIFLNLLCEKEQKINNRNNSKQKVNICIWNHFWLNMERQLEKLYEENWELKQKLDVNRALLRSQKRAKKALHFTKLSNDVTVSYFEKLKEIMQLNKK